LEDRITLWRNTLQLFYESNKPPYIGPFKKAGLTKFVVDRSFMTVSSLTAKPDIVSSGESGWVAIEMTLWSESKESQLSSYASLDPRDLGKNGLYLRTDAPDVISSRLEPITDGPYCQLILKDRLQFSNESCIKNQALKEALLNANNMDLRKLPNIPITLVPEMASKGKEVRRGISDIVMQLFDANCEGKTIKEIVDQGLERIAKLISFSDRKGLESSVKVQMDILIKDHLSEYLEFDVEHDIYRAVEMKDLHTNTMGLIAQRISEWATPAQTEISDFLKK
jgi:hypothetical protein